MGGAVEERFRKWQVIHRLVPHALGYWKGRARGGVTWLLEPKFMLRGIRFNSPTFGIEMSKVEGQLPSMTRREQLSYANAALSISGKMRQTPCDPDISSRSLKILGFRNAAPAERMRRQIARVIDDNRERRRTVFIVNRDRAGLSVANKLFGSTLAYAVILGNSDGAE